MPTLAPPDQRITARDAERLLRGQWHDLCLLRRKVIDDPIKNWIPVKIGNATEPLNLELAGGAITKRYGDDARLHHYGDISDEDHPALVYSQRSKRLYGYDEATRFICKPDGLTRINDIALPVECKHSSRNGDFITTDQRIAGWMPQLQATMLIFQTPYVLLSTLWNTDSHTLYWVPMSAVWQSQLEQSALAFAPWLEDPDLEPPFDTDNLLTELPPVEPLRFNAKAVKDWFAAQTPTQQPEVA